MPKLVTTQDQILHEYPDVFEGIRKFPGPPYHIHVDPGVTPKQTPWRPIPIHLNDAFQKEISKMLQARILVPVTKATPWINSFVLVESRDNQGQVKLRICLDHNQSKQGHNKRTLPLLHTKRHLPHASRCLHTNCV